MLQSRWDWQPPEIQEYVIRLATSQVIMNDVCRELLAYRRLEEVWGKGRIRIKIEPGYILPLPEGNILGLHKHTAIMGRYVHPVYGKTEAILGYSIEGAHRTIQQWDEI